MFQFLRLDSDDAAHGFDLGRLAVNRAAEGLRTNLNSEAFMVFIAICDLLHGLANLLTRKVSKFEWVAADSSFCLLFSRVAPERVEIRHGKRVFCIVEQSELWRDLCLDVGQFLGDPRNCLSEDDPVKSDLASAWERFRTLL